MSVYSTRTEQRRSNCSHSRWPTVWRLWRWCFIAYVWRFSLLDSVFRVLCYLFFLSMFNRNNEGNIIVSTTIRFMILRFSFIRWIMFNHGDLVPIVKLLAVPPTSLEKVLFWWKLYFTKITGCFIYSPLKNSWQLANEVKLLLFVGILIWKWLSKLEIKHKYLRSKWWNC